MDDASQDPNALPAARPPLRPFSGQRNGEQAPLKLGGRRLARSPHLPSLGRPQPSAPAAESGAAPATASAPLAAEAGAGTAVAQPEASTGESASTSAATTPVPDEEATADDDVRAAAEHAAGDGSLDLELSVETGDDDVLPRANASALDLTTLSLSEDSPSSRYVGDPSDDSIEFGARPRHELTDASAADDAVQVHDADALDADALEPTRSMPTRSMPTSLTAWSW